MAGGPGWTLQRKGDEFESWKKTIYEEDGETVKAVQLWRRLNTVFEIYTRVYQTSADLGPGALGQESGFISCLIGGILHSRTGLGIKFICMGDGIEEEQTASAYYIRRQRWVRVGKDELYGAETPEPTPEDPPS